MPDIKGLAKALDTFKAQVVHVGQFDTASIVRERRLRRDQFLEWAKDPRFANVVAYWDSSDSLFSGDTFYTEVQRINASSFRPYPAEDNAVAVIAEMGGAARTKTDENLFSDVSGSTNTLAQSFIAGMMDIVPEAFALCTNSVNAYRRLAPGSWVPKAVTWAEYTFTTSVRSVPSAHGQARLEFLSPPVDCNPYLTLTLMLGCDLDSIERNFQYDDALRTS